MTPINLDTLLTEAADRKASDIHLTFGQPPVYRIAGNLERRDETEPLDAAALEALILPALGEPQRTALLDGLSATAETMVTRDDTPVAFALTVFRAQGRLSATIRLVSAAIPTLEQIGGDTRELLERLSREPRGLILFTGPTGSGKQTTASAVVETINRERSVRLFVIEDSPFYRFESRQSVVTTLQVGIDFDSYERAAQTVLKGADPDVVFFADLPTLEAVRQALLLAETGHLVLACLHSESAPTAIAELIQAFPEPRDPARSLLSRTLVAVFNQRLLPRAGRSGRVAAYEVLLGTPEIRDQIRRGATANELRTAMQTHSADGHRTLDAAIEALLAAGAVTAEAAAQYRAGAG